MLVHSVYARGKLPASPPLIGQITQFIVHGRELEIKFCLIRLLLKLLTAVLLDSHQGLKASATYYDTVVQHGLVVAHLLERQLRSITGGAFQFRLTLLIALGHAGSKMVVAQRKA